jgi:hypothetical protein
MELSKLTPMDPRQVWPHEAHDFTPWLLDNAEHLAVALGIDLELARAEHPVGGFALDLIGMDLTHDSVLIVENQLGATDHGHLGQLITYAAGTGAKTIVWLTRQLREEHRQALDWLNEQTASDVRFFGVTVSVVRIDDSKPAPVFTVAAEPNDWQKQVRATTKAQTTGGKGELYRAFWERYLERLRATHPDWSRQRVPGTSNWTNQPAPIRGTHYSLVFPAGERLRHELYIDSGDAGRNAEIFEALREQRSAIEQAYGRPLEWEELPNRQACRVGEYTEGDVSQSERYDEYIDWFFDAGERFRRAMAMARVPPATGTGDPPLGGEQEPI